jgi:hypothetical protein
VGIFSRPQHCEPSSVLVGLVGAVLSWKDTSTEKHHADHTADV